MSSPDQREGQPRKGIELLMPVPDIRLPHYANDLGFYLKKEGTILYQNRDLVVTNVVYPDGDQPNTGENFGALYVHNKKNGLPNFAAEYTLINRELEIEGGHTWEYKTVLIPFSKDPIIEATEHRHFPPNEEGDGVQYVRKTILDIYIPDDLIYGDGDFAYEKKKLDFDENSKQKLRAIHGEISLLPLRETIKPLNF